MLPGKFIPIIKTIAGQCHHLGLTWAFTGSLNLVMWGFDLEPHDIDLETDRYGAEQFDLLNADRAVWALQLRQSEVMQSWFARYDFDGVQVEVMGIAVIIVLMAVGLSRNHLISAFVGGPAGIKPALAESG
jgi:hypothetical protein